MAKFVAFDVETTGLPANGSRDPTNYKKYDTCRLVSIGIVEYCDDKELGNIDFLVKPDDFQVKATEIHGITHQQALEEGHEFDVIYYTLKDVFESVDFVVGHNINFDINCINAECYRRDYEPLKPQTVCTQKMSREILFKNYRLGSVYKLLFGEELQNWHSALADSRASAQIYLKLKNFETVELPEITPKKVWVSVSDVGTIIGKCKFNGESEILDKLLSKYFPEKFEEYTREYKQRMIIKDSPKSQEVISQAIDTETNTSDEVNTLFESVKDTIMVIPELCKEEKYEVCEYIRKVLNTRHGDKSEPITAEKLGNLEKDEKFYRHKITTIHGTDYILCGRIDGFMTEEDGSRTLYEIKNRTRQLFNKVRDYELTQVNCYLNMTKTKKAKLVEMFNNEMKSYDISANHEEFKSYLSTLENFCRAFHFTASI